MRMTAAARRSPSSCLLGHRGARGAATEIDLFFPVPVQGKLANEMQRLIEQFNSSTSGHPRHRRLYRQLRRHQPQDARRDQGRASRRRR